MKEKTKQKIKKIALDACVVIVAIVLVLGIFKLSTSAAENENVSTYAACSHEYTNGICTKCGFACPHQNISSKGHCIDCLYPCARSHTFNDVGICALCGYECPHNHTTERITQGDVFGHKIYIDCTDCPYSFPVSVESHSYDGFVNRCICIDCGYMSHVWNGGFCSRCGASCSHTSINTFGQCVDCGFCVNVKHDFSDGICFNCSYSCPHSATENVYVPNDLVYHSYTTRCSDCKMVLHTNSAEHTFVGDVCKYCGYENPHMFVLSADKTRYVCSGCGLEYLAKLVSKDVEHFSHPIQITPYSIKKTQIEGEYYGDSGTIYRRFISTEIIPSDDNNSGNFGFLIDLNCPDVNGSYKYAVVRMRTNAPIGDGHTFWRFVVNFGNGDKNLRLDKNAVCTNEWVTYVVDLSAFNSGKVPDKLIKFQLMDFYGKGVLNNNSYQGYYVDVSYAALVDDLHDVVGLLDTDNVSFSTSAGTSTTYSESQLDDMSHNWDYQAVWLGQKEHSSYKECTICGVRREYLGVQPHQWNDSGKCPFCLYVCIHTFSNGTCTNCGYVCSHKDLSITKRTYIDTSYHEDLWECAKCDYSYIDKQPHVFAIGDTQGDNVDDYKCEHCKHYVIIAENYYEIGYNQGLVDGADMDSGSIAEGFVFGAYDGMTNIFFSMLGYEILGVNIAQLIISLIAIAVVVFVVKKVI